MMVSYCPFVVLILFYLVENLYEKKGLLQWVTSSKTTIPDSSSLTTTNGGGRGVCCAGSSRREHSLKLKLSPS